MGWLGCYIYNLSLTEAAILRCLPLLIVNQGGRHKEIASINASLMEVGALGQSQWRCFQDSHVM